MFCLAHCHKRLVGIEISTVMHSFARIAITCILLAGCSRPLDPDEQVRLAAIGAGAAALSGTAEHALVGSMGHGVSLWRIADRERLFDWSHKRGADTDIAAADFSPEGKWAITVDGQTLALWSAQSGEGLRFWQAPAAINAVQLGPDGNLALLGLADHTAVLFDARNGGIKHTFNHAAKINSVAISDDGKIALTGSSDYNAVAWNLRSGKPLHKIRHNDAVQLVALSPDGALALSVSQYDRALIWSTSSGEILGEVPLAGKRLRRGERFTSARFSEDKQWLLTGQPNRLITLWRLPIPAAGDAPVAQLGKHSQWRIPSKNPWQPSGATVLDVAFAADAGRYLALASDGNLYWLTAPNL